MLPSMTLGNIGINDGPQWNALAVTWERFSNHLFVAKLLLRCGCRELIITILNPLTIVLYSSLKRPYLFIIIKTSTMNLPEMGLTNFHYPVAAQSSSVLHASNSTATKAPFRDIIPDSNNSTWTQKTNRLIVMVASALRGSSLREALKAAVPWTPPTVEATAALNAQGWARSVTASYNSTGLV